MRCAVLLATAVLIAGCSHTITGHPESETSTPPAGTSSSALPPQTTAPGAPPPDGAAATDVIAWVEVGEQIDTGPFHTATRDGASRDLGEDIAFLSGKTRCMTDQKYAADTLMCLVDLADPPPKPDSAYGEWIGGWVDYTGADLQVGSVHGDPGPFSKGDGADLPEGQTLRFGDFRCRAHDSDLYCVNYAHQSAVRMSAAGVVPFGCLESVPAPEGVGLKFAC